MKKFFAFAVLFAAVAMVSCGGQQKKAEDAATEEAKACVECTEACCEECADACCEECAEVKECCGEECPKTECCGDCAEAVVEEAAAVVAE